ncbi:unnamed protein product [Clonostachys rosea]|uniref:Membrane-associated protein n=1 Tax=Bionectria ochroleuca TaxID=29856 RepID=A0ABY6TWI0_BIOOC|nr:unnamed protein product [Clonostachys rosea]
MFVCAVGRWVATLVSVGLSITVLTRSPHRRLLIAAAYNIAIGGLHLCLAFAPAEASGKTNSRPQSWFYLVAIISSLISLPAVIFLFLFRGLSENEHGESADDDRAGMGISESVAIACGCTGIIILIWNLAQCYYMHELAFTDFPVGELQAGYAEVVQKFERGSRNFITTIM